MELNIFSGLLRYHPDTGLLYWKEDRGRMAKKGNKAGTKTKHGYIRVWVSGKNYPAHKVAWLLFHGSWPIYIDHIDGDRSNNKIKNLRLSNPSDNSKNRKRPSNNTTGCTGVYSYPGNKWQARIHSKGKRYILGMFDSFEEAKKARKAAEIKHGFSSGHDRVISLG